MKNKHAVAMALARAKKLTKARRLEISMMGVRAKAAKKAKKDFPGP